MDVIEAIHGRRSIRAFRRDPIDRAILEALIWDAAQAPPPTAGFARRWLFHVVDDAERLDALGEAAMAFARAERPAGSGRWVDRPGFRVFWGAPALILISCPADDIHSVEDCGRAGQTLLLSAHARGLGACWVGSALPWFGAAEGKAALKIPAGHVAVAPIIVGRAAGEMPEPPVRQHPEIVWC